MKELFFIICPECDSNSHCNEWKETEIGCPDCGTHDAFACPECGECFDHIWEEETYDEVERSKDCFRDPEKAFEHILMETSLDLDFKQADFVKEMNRRISMFIHQSDLKFVELIVKYC